MTSGLKMCSYCGSLTHRGLCPRVEQIEYFEDGRVKSVKLFDPRVWPIIPKREGD